MSAFRSSHWAIPPVLAVMLAGCFLGSAAGHGDINDRERLISWLRHQEEIVKSMCAEFEKVVQPVTLEQAAAVRQIFHDRKQDDLYEASVVTPERARDLSYVQQWWRKGPKERFNSFYGIDFAHLSADLSQLTPGTTLAFDGQIVRELSPYNKEAGGPTASISTEQNSHWKLMNRSNPFSMLYMYYEVPYSRLIQEATAFHSAAINRDGKRLLQVSFTCSGTILASLALELLFDENHRLVERRELRIISPAVTALLRKQIFSDYRAYPDPSGETIWFPNEATYLAYANLRSGKTVEVGTSRIKVRNLQFNIEIPDDFFELRIPKNAKINDGVTGLGWLPEGQRPDVLFPSEAKTRRWTWTAITALTVILVLAVVVVWRRRKTSRIAPSPGGQ